MEGAAGLSQRSRSMARFRIQVSCRKHNIVVFQYQMEFFTKSASMFFSTGGFSFRKEIAVWNRFELLGEILRRMCSGALQESKSFDRAH